MPRMLSREKFPPGGGFHVLHPEAGMVSPFVGSFRECVNFEAGFRRKNPALAEKLRLSPDLASVEAWVDEQNAIRCLQHGWGNFVMADASPFTIDEAQKKSLFARVAGGLASGKAALSAYQSMFGPEGPVGTELAERRAAVCASCPQNDTKNGIYAYFVKAAADEIMSILGALKDLNLTTSRDSDLGICQACNCPMRAKVFVNIKNIGANVPADARGKLQKEDPRCWILAEMEP